MTFLQPGRCARRVSFSRTAFLRAASLYCCAGISSAVWAVDLPLTRLDGLAPAAAVRGGEEQITVTGADLEGVDSAWFSHPGIQATLVKEKVFAVKVDEAVPEGVYDMRLFGTHGVSNPRAFLVDRSKTVLKAGECSFAKPMEIPIGQAVQGSVVAASRDYFRFSAQKGQRLVVRCITHLLDSRLQPVFAVLDAGGRKLRGNERKDFVEFEAPESGTYLVSVQDTAYAGGADLFYRLVVDESPVVEAVLPSVVQFGKKTRLQVFGRGLAGSKPSGLKAADGRELEMAEVEIEPSPVPGVDGVAALGGASLETWSFRVQSQKGTSNALPLLALREAVPVHNAAANASPVSVTVPGCVSGLFGKGYAGVPVEFEAKKGEILLMEVVSHRLGETRANPYLRLVKGDAQIAEAYAPDANVGGLRLSTIHNDPSLRFECKEDGKYTLYLTDLSGAVRGGPGARYVVSLKREEPTFSLVVATEPPPETANDRNIQPRGCVLRAGGTAPMRVVALRGGGFTGEIVLSAEDLPPGVTCSPARIPAGKTEAALILSAPADATRSLATIRVVGRAADGKIQREARWATARWVVADYTISPHEPRLARGSGIPLATTPAKAPLNLVPEPTAAVEVKQGGKVDVAVRIQRSSEFNIPLKIKTGGFAGAETIKEVDADAKAESVKVQLDTAALKLAPGRHFTYFTVQAKAKVAGRDVVTTAFSPAVEIAVQPAQAGNAAKGEGAPAAGTK